MTPQEIIKALGLQAHPEGGHYVEIYRDGGSRPGSERGALSSIYFLLQAGERSHWHRVKDAAEIWAWHGGAPLRLSIAEKNAESDVTPQATILGLDLAAGQRPQAVVPAGAWQSAQSLGPWTLVGCMVAPAFTFESFELAPPTWQPRD